MQNNFILCSCVIEVKVARTCSIEEAMHSLDIELHIEKLLFHMDSESKMFLVTSYTLLYRAAHYDGEENGNVGVKAKVAAAGESYVICCLESSSIKIIIKNAASYHQISITH